MLPEIGRFGAQGDESCSFEFTHLSPIDCCASCPRQYLHTKHVTKLNNNYITFFPKKVSATTRAGLSLYQTSQSRQSLSFPPPSPSLPSIPSSRPDTEIVALYGYATLQLDDNPRPLVQRKSCNNLSDQARRNYRCSEHRRL